MPALRSFDYAIIRVVPRVEREEFINAGVILFCYRLSQGAIESVTHATVERCRSAAGVRAEARIPGKGDPPNPARRRRARKTRKLAVNIDRGYCSLCSLFP